MIKIKMTIDFQGDEFVINEISDFTLFLNDDFFVSNFENNNFSARITKLNNQTSILIAFNDLMCIDDPLKGAKISDANTLKSANDILLAIKTQGAPFLKIYNPISAIIEDDTTFFEADPELIEIWTSTSHDYEKRYCFSDLIRELTHNDN